jgi:hypothetical protein
MTLIAGRERLFTTMGGFQSSQQLEGRWQRSDFDRCREAGGVIQKHLSPSLGPQTGCSSRCLTMSFDIGRFCSFRDGMRSSPRRQRPQSFDYPSARRTRWRFDSVHPDSASSGSGAATSRSFVANVADLLSVEWPHALRLAGSASYPIASRVSRRSSP